MRSFTIRIEAQLPSPDPPNPSRRGYIRLEVPAKDYDEALSLVAEALQDVVGRHVDRVQKQPLVVRAESVICVKGVGCKVSMRLEPGEEIRPGDCVTLGTYASWPVIAVEMLGGSNARTMVLPMDAAEKIMVGYALLVGRPAR